MRLKKYGWSQIRMQAKIDSYTDSRMALSCGVIFGNDWFPPILMGATAYTVASVEETVAVEGQQEVDAS